MRRCLAIAILVAAAITAAVAALTKAPLTLTETPLQPGAPQAEAFPSYPWLNGSRILLRTHGRWQDDSRGVRGARGRENSGLVVREPPRGMGEGR